MTVGLLKVKLMRFEQTKISPHAEFVSRLILIQYILGGCNLFIEISLKSLITISKL